MRENNIFRENERGRQCGHANSREVGLVSCMWTAGHEEGKRAWRRGRRGGRAQTTKYNKEFRGTFEGTSEDSNCTSVPTSNGSHLSCFHLPTLPPPTLTAIQLSTHLPLPCCCNIGYPSLSSIFTFSLPLFLFADPINQPSHNPHTTLTQSALNDGYPP